MCTCVAMYGVVLVYLKEVHVAVYYVCVVLMLFIRARGVLETSSCFLGWATSCVWREEEYQ